MWRQIIAAAAALRSLSDFGQLGQRLFVVLCAENSVEWPVVEFACTVAGLRLVPLFTSQLEAALVSVLQQFDPNVVVVDAKWVPVVRAACRQGPPGRIRHVVVIPDGGHPTAAAPEGSPTHEMAFTDLLNLGNAKAEEQSSLRAVADVPLPPGLDEDIAALFTTSGSSGVPKFCIRRLSTTLPLFASAIAAKRFDNLDPSPLYLAVSHFAHSGQRQLLWISIMQGGQHALYQHRWAAQCGILDAARRLMPTSFSAAPVTLLELCYQLQCDIAADPEHRGDVVERYRQYVAPVLVRVPQRRVVSGGAGIDPQALALLREVFDCAVVDGYGTTECGPIAASGRLQPGVVMRLEPVPDLEYYPEDKPYPRGEVCVKTPMPFHGYFGDPEATQAVTTADGFYCTGDIAEQISPEEFRLIDRKSNVKKLANGKFVAVEALEKVYSGVDGVVHICIVVDPRKSYLLAVVATGTIPVDDRGAAKAQLLAQFAVAAKRAGLAPYETPVDVHLVREPFSIANGLLNPSFKLDRKRIAETFTTELRALQDQHEAGLEALLESLDHLLDAPPGPLEGDAALQHLGVDSTKLMMVGQRIRTRFNVLLPLPVILGCSSMADLRCAIQAAQGGGPSEPDSDPQTLAAIAELQTIKEDISLPGPRGAAEPAWPGLAGVRRALLTGATGFLGCFLLAELLGALPEAQVTCLVRGPQASDRLLAAARRNRVDLQAHLPSQRLRIVQGDIAAPSLGLGPEEWAALAAATDLVVHSAATVNWSSSYAHLHAPNVGGTAEVVRFCQVSGARLVFVSTGAARDTFEVTPEQLKGCGGQGYGLSKLVAEALVWKAWKCGLPVLILRAGYIGWHTQLGACNPTDILSRLVLGALELGAFYDAAVPMACLPVDTFAALALAVMRHSALPRLFHPMIAPAPLFTSQTILGALQTANAALRAVPYPDWYRLATEGNASHLQALLPHLSQDRPPLAADDTRYDWVWEWLGFGFPQAVDAAAVDRMVRFLVDATA
eukprot:EG_transcript_982